MGFGERAGRILRMGKERSGEVIPPIGDTFSLDKFPAEFRAFIHEVSANALGDGGTIRLTAGKSYDAIYTDTQLMGQLEAFLARNKGKWRLYENIEGEYKIGPTLEYDHAAKRVTDTSPIQPDVL